jgi:Domain of unknown function (DUF4157)
MIFKETNTRQKSNSSSDQLLRTRIPTYTQPKLTINNPDDHYEKEADKMANQVMQMETSSLQQYTHSNLFFSPTPISRKVIQQKCAHCEGEETMQRKETSRQEATADNNLENYVSNLNGGQSLPAELRNAYELKFGYDFSNVKVHTDTDAVRSAQSINALAYTTGPNIIFNQGQYSPQTDSGKRLLGHELTHVVQQHGVSGGKIMRQPAKKENPNQDIIDELKKNPIFKKLPKAAQDKIIEELKSAPQKIGQKALERLIDLLNVDDKLKEGLKKAVEAIFEVLNKKPKKFSVCDVPGFHPAGSSQFKGMCCTSSIESAATCCPPQRMSINERRCCQPNEDLKDGNCVKKSKTGPVFQCPGNTPKTLDGQCCIPPKVSNIVTCIDPPSPQPIPPPPQPQPVIENISNIGFNKDAPQTWYAPEASFKASVTKNGQGEFKTLVEFLKANPSTNVQIQGHASSEKPQNILDYNQKLTDRRVVLIMTELQKSIDNSRLKNIPDDPANAGCKELSTGVHSCGDVQAQKTVEASDRNVTVKVFEIK